MSAKHTPGPWKVDKHGLLVSSAKNEAMRICDIRGWGYLTGCGGGLALSDEDAIAIQMANAHLIAAAPDLLEAARKAHRYLEIEVSPYLKPHSVGSLFALAAAIAKAEGGQ